MRVRSWANGPVGVRTRRPDWPCDAEGSDVPDGTDVARRSARAPEEEDESVGAAMGGRVGRSMGIAFGYAGRLAQIEAERRALWL